MKDKTHVRPSSAPKPPAAQHHPKPTAVHLPPEAPTHHATVQEPIHHPEQDQTILRRWVDRALETGWLWYMIAIAVAVPIVGVVLANMLGVGGDTRSEAWTDLALSKGTVEDLKSVAEKYEGEPAATWALIMAAGQLYGQGLNDLPAQREAADATLSSAQKLFEQAATEAKPRSDAARFATLGLAHALEARNRLDQAIEKYKVVADTWPKSPEAKEATEAIEALKQPENRKFYEELYTMKIEPPASLTAPGGTTPPAGITLPPALSDMPDTGSPLLDLPKSGILPPSATQELPDDPFAPAGPTKTEPPAKTDPEPTPKAELPADPFTPPQP